MKITELNWNLVPIGEVYSREFADGFVGYPESIADIQFITTTETHTEVKLFCFGIDPKESYTVFQEYFTNRYRGPNEVDLF